MRWIDILKKEGRTWGSGTANEQLIAMFGGAGTFNERAVAWFKSLGVPGNTVSELFANYWNRDAGPAPGRAEIRYIGPQDLDQAMEVGEVQQPIDFSSYFTVSGYNGPVFYSIVGTLPPGMTFTQFGQLEGIPQVAGTFTFQVEAQLQTGLRTRSPQATYTVTVAVMDHPIYNGSPVSDFNLDQNVPMVAFDASNYFTYNGPDSVVYSIIGNLPAGITLDQDTGVLSGTPTEAGTFNFKFRAETTGGHDDTFTSTMLVEAVGILP